MPGHLTDLRAAFRAKGSVAVAFSGGVDSAVLARVASDELGDRALAVIVDSESYPRAEREAAVAFAREMGLPFEVVWHSELADPQYRANPVDRCFHCRRGLSEVVGGLAKVRGFAAVAAGTHTDDLGEWRPGLRALREAGVWQPFLDLGMGKADVRAVARELGLPVAEKPSLACLSSRIPYGEAITEATLRRVERAEVALAALGYRQVRVRTYGGDRARVEVAPADVPRALADVARIEEALRAEGYAAIEVDPKGYRSGSMSEGVRLPVSLRSG